MATSTSGPTAALQHLVHQPRRTTQERSSSSDPNLGIGPPPATLGDQDEGSISPVTITPPDAATSNMNAVNWGAPNSSSMVVPTFPTKATGSPVVIASSGIRVENPPTTASSSTSKQTFSMGRSNSSPASTSRRKGGTASSGAEKEGGTTNNRRQKRLERNRESARLSRMRRKQYLEVLEDRVTKLSLEMDKGRREHVFAAMETIKAKREHVLANGGVPMSWLYSVLGRTSTELRVASTFQTQQLQSLSLPTNVKFLLWLMLQNDSFFRGGRAASERLSAARIGERMLTGGNDKVPPSRGMWPLLCNEVGLSYDQEERVRGFQRQLLLCHESWIHRHTGAASKLAMDSTHDCLQASMHATGERERGVFGCLTEEQQLKMLQWASKNADRLKRLQEKKKSPVVIKKEEEDGKEFSDKHHDAANLYILHHRMQKTLGTLPANPTLVPGPSLKRLSRRPSFESLQSSSTGAEKNYKDGGSRPLSREVSFSSEGSLKRSLDDMNSLDPEDEDRHTVHHVTPEEAQTAAGPAIEEALGFIKDLVPPPKPPPKLAAPDNVVSSNFVLPQAFKVPTSRQVLPHPGAPPPQQHLQQQQPQQVQYVIQQAAPALVGSNPTSPGMTMAAKYTVDEIPPFLPPNLNVVPEEGHLPGGGGSAEDFLFDLTEEDWAIGAGLDMDTAA